MRKALFLAFVLSVVVFSGVSGAKAMFYDSASSAPAAAAPAQLNNSNVADKAVSNYGMQTFVLKYVDAKPIAETLSKLLSASEMITYNEQVNSIIVRASMGTINRLKNQIAILDAMPLQVHVEAKIIETRTGFGDTTNPSSLGVSWKYMNTPGSQNFVQFNDSLVPTAGAVAQGLYAQVLKDNVDAYLNALEKNIGYDVLASPSISALNHEEASIFIGGKIGYRNLYTTQTGTLQEVEYIESGTKLVFVPHISSDGYIKMSIYPSVSDGRLTSDLLPVIDTTETKNFVLIKDGETVVIGGLSRNYKNEVSYGVPILSQIPILGTFFRRTEIVSQKRDIIVLITPHIVTPEFEKTLMDKAGNVQDKQDKKINDNRLIY